MVRFGMFASHFPHFAALEDSFTFTSWDHQARVIKLTREKVLLFRSDVTLDCSQQAAG